MDPSCCLFYRFLGQVSTSPLQQLLGDVDSQNSHKLVPHRCTLHGQGYPINMPHLNASREPALRAWCRRESLMAAHLSTA